MMKNRSLIRNPLNVVKSPRVSIAYTSRWISSLVDCETLFSTKKN